MGTDFVSDPDFKLDTKLRPNTIPKTKMSLNPNT